MSNKVPKKIDESIPRGNKDVVFINFDLDESNKARLKEWRSTYDERIFDLLDSLVDSGYAVSCKQDTYNKCMGAFILCKVSGNENNGCILTGRGSTAHSALMGVLFRHFCLFKEQWPTYNRLAALTDDIE